MRNYFLIAIIISFTMPVWAYTLHYGDKSVELTDTKHTNPSLHIQINNELAYGALYETPAPGDTLRINYNNSEYWVGEWCGGGTYLPDGLTACINCGYGYYCTGGTARDVCSGGAIGCNTKTMAKNTGADASLLNRPLTAQEVDTYMPATDLADWVRIDKAIYEPKLPTAGGVPVDDYANNPEYGNTGTIVPGTYLFIIRGSPSACPADTDVLTGAKGSTNAFIAVFDRPASYKFLRGTNAVYIYLDTQHAEYTAYDIRLPDFGPSSFAYCNNDFWANVTNIATLSTDAQVIYRLK